MTELYRMIDLDARYLDPPAFWANDRLHFFKYMSAGTAKIVLQNRTLRWSTRASVNDPFELAFDLEIRGDKAAIREAALEKMWSVYSGPDPIQAVNPMGVALEFLRVRAPGIEKHKFKADFAEAFDQGIDNLERTAAGSAAAIRDMFDHSKVLSLTIRPDILLMWAHYADSHRGVVFRFRSLPESPYGMARPVDYTDDVPEFFPEEYLIDSVCGLASLDAAEIIHRIIYRKSLTWASEQEWRIDAGDGRDRDAPHEDILFIRDELDGVIFGARTSNEDNAEIIQLSQAYPAVEFMQASIFPELGKMDIDVIE